MGGGYDEGGSVVGGLAERMITLAQTSFCGLKMEKIISLNLFSVLHQICCFVSLGSNDLVAFLIFLTSFTPV